MNLRLPGLQTRTTPLDFTTNLPSSLRAAFKSEIHRFAVASYSITVFNEELDWLKDLYVSRGYPPETVIAWIKKFKESAYKTRLDWKPPSEGGDQAVWPLKSTMNPVWTKLSLINVTEAMRKAMQPSLDKEMEEYELSDSEDEYPLAFKFNKWFKRLVASQKRPRNMGDKENKHNKELLGRSEEHTSELQSQ